MSALSFDYVVPGDDFTQAGAASSDVKRKLKKIGYDADVIRRVAIAMYEGEINMVIHANGGDIRCEVETDKIRVVLADQGPGIPNLELAMQAGWSTASQEARELGFGAGMGFPNMKKYSDALDVQTEVGVGTTLTLDFLI